jgi:hypothetical protein
MPEELKFDDPPPVLADLPTLTLPELGGEERITAGPGLSAVSNGREMVVSLVKPAAGRMSVFHGDQPIEASALDYLASLMFWVTKTATGFRTNSGHFHLMRYSASVWNRQTVVVATTNISSTATSGYIYLKVPTETATGPSGFDTGSWAIEGNIYSYTLTYSTAYNVAKVTPAPSIELTSGVKNHGDDAADWYLLAVIADGQPQQRHAGMVLMLQAAVPYVSDISVSEPPA